MLTEFSDSQTVLRLVCTLGALSVIRESVEYLSTERQFRADGMFSWDIVSRRFAGLQGQSAAKWLLTPLFGHRGMMVVIGVRVVAAAILAATTGRVPYRMLPILCLFLTGMYLNVRMQKTSGADAISRITFGVLAIAELDSHEPVLREVALWAIAIQSVTAYCANGWKKLPFAAWRSGVALQLIARDELFDRSNLAEWLETHPAVCRLVTWNTLAVECLFPCALLLGSTGCCLFLLWGILFHTLNALVLRVSLFFWSFVATYPAILFAAQRTAAIWTGE